MIELRELRKVFGSLVAVNGVSLTVGRGEVLGFLGPNGAGKSTTMKMVTGFLTPTSGTALVGGHDVREHPIRVKRAVGYLPEGAPAYPDMTPESFLRFVAAARGFTGAEARSRIGSVAQRISLNGVMRQPIETLSKGYKRRVGLAQALLHDPDVLILDEPTDGLDPNQKHEVRELIRGLGDDKAVILSTHILEEVEAVCTRAVIIANGSIVADSTPDALRARSIHHNAVCITLRAHHDGLENTLRAIEGVSSLEPLPITGAAAAAPPRAWRIIPREGRNILAPVSDCLRANGLEIEEIRVERGRLDEVFRTLTLKPPHESHRPSPEPAHHMEAAS